MSPFSSLVSQALAEMKDMAEKNVDCWYHRVSKLKTLFQIPNFNNQCNCKWNQIRFEPEIEYALYKFCHFISRDCKSGNISRAVPFTKKSTTKSI